MTEATPSGPEETPGRHVRGTRRALAARWSRRLVAVVIAIVAGVLVMTFTIDLGRFPGLKARAERYATTWLDRPVHIGKLSASIAPGLFILDHVVIEGKHPGDRPFFEAGRVWAYVPITSIVTRRISVLLRITDWRMVEELWHDGSSQPRLSGPPRTPSKSKSPFTTTVRVYALRGEFLYDDHLTPWSVDAPNLGFSLVRAENLHQYVGGAAFSGGTVRIQNYKPMPTSMSTRFVLDGTKVTLNHIDLTTDGTRSHVTGFVDFSRWPEQSYNVNSTIDFARMRDIFFADQPWHLAGSGQFTGIFRLYREGGRELAGNFASEDAQVDDLVFPHLHGSLVWAPDRFEVTHAESEFVGGTTRFAFGMAPLGRPGGSTSTFSAEYENVDLAGVNRIVNLKSLQMTGRASGQIDAAWPTGKFHAGRRGSGRTVVAGPPGVQLATRALPAAPRAIVPEPAPFASIRPLDPLALAADVRYAFDPDGWTFENSWAATPYTFVDFSGRLATNGTTSFPFHATSHDWQESDRVLARIITAVSGPTGAIPVGGRGTFDGTMTGSFASPRIEGHFSSEGTRAWDVDWGRTDAGILIENHYVTVAHGTVQGGAAGSSIAVDGRFRLGYAPDASEEINAKLTFARWPMRDLRHAFELDDWSMDGLVRQADLSLTGQYRNMFGTGRLQIEEGVAWGEHFDTASGDIDLEGSGMRMHRIEMVKGPGLILGDIRVGWNGTYAFTATTAPGKGVPVELLDNFKLPNAPLSGRLKFSASGAGPFAAPSYDFNGGVEDLFVGDQGIGNVQGQLHVEHNTLYLKSVTANSGLLDVFGTGTIALNDRSDAELHMRFTSSSLDPYVKFFSPRLSPYVRAILSGSVDASGPLSTPKDLTVKANIGSATLTLLDYDLSNDATEPILLDYENEHFRVGQLKLKGGAAGNQTNLELTGDADARGRTWNLATSGAAGLSILQGFFPGITASGAATLSASLRGTFDAPLVAGSATIADGRLRPLNSPHSLERINGRIQFGASGVTVDESVGLTGEIGNGLVNFGGNIAMEGYRLSRFNLTARGRSMTLRYPVGFRSLVDMDLALVGPLNAPRLTGDIEVIRVVLAAGVDTSVFGLPGLGSSSTPAVELPADALASAGGGTEIALDLSVRARRMRMIDTKIAHVDGAGALHVGGTFDKPAITGTVEIVGGDMLYNGHRYQIREGTIEFRNPDRIEPVFDLAADTRPIINGQTYDIHIRLTGPLDRFTPTLTSDPALPETDIVSIIFGGAPDLTTAEQLALRSPQDAQQRMMQNAMAALMAAPLSSRVSNLAQKTRLVDTVQITPAFAGDTPLQQLNPTARMTLGRWISPRVFLTYSANVSGRQDEIILLEYDQNDRISWILSRNENRTYALDFRIRYLH